MSSIAVVILNYNGQNFLKEFLPSVIKFSQEARIIVADNASTDNSLEILKNDFPEVEVIINKENGGFAKGYNDALAQVESEYYVLLNSDIEVTENWLSAPIQLLQDNPEVVACQPKILSHTEPSHFEHAGAAGGFIDKWGYPFCRGRVFDQIEKDEGQYDNDCEIFWATGACLFIKSSIYHKMGGLDNNFFAHMEEIDLCWRIKNAGYKIMYSSKSHIYHVGGGTLKRSNPKKTYLNFRNGLVLLYKNLPRFRLWRTIIWRLMLDGVAGIAFLLSGKPKHTLAVIRAHCHFYGGFKKWKPARKLSQRFAKSHDHPQILHRSIVWLFFIEKVKRFSKIRFK